jgi:hypothetical protein
MSTHQVPLFDTSQAVLLGVQRPAVSPWQSHTGNSSAHNKMKLNYSEILYQWK